MGSASYRPVARMESELARGVDPDQALDRQAAGRAVLLHGSVSAVVSAPGAGQPTRAAHGPIIA